MNRKRPSPQVMVHTIMSALVCQTIHIPLLPPLLLPLKHLRWAGAEEEGVSGSQWAGTTNFPPGVSPAACSTCLSLFISIPTFGASSQHSVSKYSFPCQGWNLIPLGTQVSANLSVEIRVYHPRIFHHGPELSLTTFLQGWPFCADLAKASLSWDASKIMLGKRKVWSRELDYCSSARVLWGLGVLSVTLRIWWKTSIGVN